MNKVNFKDISEFELKETLDGTEEIQVSSTEKINLKDQFDKANNLYVADFTIEDLENSLATNSILKINARALIQALSDKKAIGVLQKETTSDDYVSMLIASAYKDGRSISLTVTSGLKMYDVIIDSGAAISPEVADSESGQIHWGFIQVIPIETSFAPFPMSSVINATEGIQWRVHKDSLMAILETNKPLFIQDNSLGVVPTSYLITKQDDGNPIAIDIDIIYNKGLYHIHWDITDDPNLLLNPDTVSYTPFTDVYMVTEFTIEDIIVQSTAENPQLTISRDLLDAMYKGISIRVKSTLDPDSWVVTVPIIVYRANNPNNNSTFQFKVQYNNTEYQVTHLSKDVITGTVSVEVGIAPSYQSDAYIVSEFTVELLKSLGQGSGKSLHISRAFLDAAYKGVPIMVKLDTDNAATVPVIVESIADPNTTTSITFRVQPNSTVYRVVCSTERVITGTVSAPVTIALEYLIDWNQNSSSGIGYIANRTHRIGYMRTCGIGQRVSLANFKGGHYIDNYKLLYNGKFYDLPKVKDSEVSIGNYFKIIFTDYTESSSSTTTTTTYLFQSVPLSAEQLPSTTYMIIGDFENGGFMALDEFFLPDGAKPWKIINATITSSPLSGFGSGYVFRGLSKADIANTENVLRNNTIYTIDHVNQILIDPTDITSMLEFKLKMVGPHNVIFETGSEFLWENGVKPTSASEGDIFICSFLILDGVVYASAKVYKTE